MNIRDIASKPWMDAKAQSALVPLVQEALEGLEGKISTTALLHLLGADMANDYGVKNVLAHLSNARRAGKLERYWSTGKPVMGTGGHPSIKWHKRIELTAEQRMKSIEGDRGQS